MVRWSYTRLTEKSLIVLKKLEQTTTINKRSQATPPSTKGSSKNVLDNPTMYLFRSENYENGLHKRPIRCFVYIHDTPKCTITTRKNERM